MAARKGGEISTTVERRLIAELGAALKRKPVSEPVLAGALRAVAPISTNVCDALADAAEVLVRRRSFDRCLYGAAVRTLVDAKHKRAPAILATALGCDDAGGLSTLSAACFTKDPLLTVPLARAASSRHAHTSFAAEVARLARGEPTGPRLAAMAPMIKESHRIALCVDLFVPLVRAPPLGVGVAPALAVLRDAERHLGRWLVMAEVASRAGDPKPLMEAEERSRLGPSSSRAAWAFVAWALTDRADAPSSRPTTELIARLSDRPSSHRDTTFLFRLAAAKAPCAAPALDALVKTQPLHDEVAVRAARCLGRAYARSDVADNLRRIASDDRREPLRGLAAAALWDVGEGPLAVETADALVESKALGTAVWSALVRRAAESERAKPERSELVVEQTFRRIQWGWVE